VNIHLFKILFFVVDFNHFEQKKDVFLLKMIEKKGVFRSFLLIYSVSAAFKLEAIQVVLRMV